MSRKSIVPVFTLAAVSAFVCAADAAVVFTDGFDNSVSGTDTNVNLNIPARQAGGLTTSTYTEFATAGSDALIQNDAPQLGGSDALILRTARSAATGPNRTAVQLDTDFAAQLIGQRYTVSFDFTVDTTTGANNDIWLGFGLAGTSPVSFPTASADYGVLVRPDGRSVQYDDAVTTASPTDLAPAPGIGGIGRVSILIDETGLTPTATLTYSSLETGGGSLTLGSFAFDFEAGDLGRFIELRAHQGGGAQNAALADFRVDNLLIETTPIPEPMSAAVGLLGLAGCVLRRRRA